MSKSGNTHNGAITMQSKVEITAQLPVVIKKRQKYYLASCPLLDVHSQGETEEQAKKNLAEAVSLFLFSCIERGTLDAVLKKCGFSISKAVEHKPKPKYKDFFDVSIPLFANDNELNECHA